ncbi:MAG TPA: bifunctional phosphoglucose/phosphomannose isomerase [Candidatus Paceibacterota bacterium]|nr:bifunctional phosphoglucose/phosphomannose isomerase [Candidatus Paceibacterota bacterium]
MEDLIDNFSNQLKEGLQIGREAKLGFSGKIFKNAVICGLGGSGIGGTIVAELTQDSANVPVTVCKDYFLPNFVSEDTLVIASSYSGNTEETLFALDAALKKGATAVCISSGGKLIEVAKEKNLLHIIIPGGHPPRACLGYSLVQLLFVLKASGIISHNFESELESAISLLQTEGVSVKTKAQKIAEEISGKLPVIYSVAGFEGVAVRFCQQINENAKLLCWHNVIPEMNHNELVGWHDQNDSLVVLVLRNETDFDRSQSRIEHNKSIISKKAGAFIEIFSKGESKLERMLYLIHLTDYVSLFLANKRGVDVVEVKVIEGLKDMLSKL